MPPPSPRQTALTVAVGEEACQFEHRDLHWGNLLIRRGGAPAATAAVRARLRGVELEAATEGVTVGAACRRRCRAVPRAAPQALCSFRCGAQGPHRAAGLLQLLCSKKECCFVVPPALLLTALSTPPPTPHKTTNLARCASSTSRCPAWSP
jgi:hypothetical protein